MQNRPQACNTAGCKDLFWPSRKTGAGPSSCVSNPIVPFACGRFCVRSVSEPSPTRSWFINEWVDTPARMLAPLIVAAVENSGTFRAVVLTPSAATGDLRLDTGIMRLQHDFGSQPSRVRFTLRAYIFAPKRQRTGNPPLPKSRNAPKEAAMLGSGESARNRRH